MIGPLLTFTMQLITGFQQNFEMSFQGQIKRDFDFPKKIQNAKKRTLTLPRSIESLFTGDVLVR